MNTKNINFEKSSSGDEIRFLRNQYLDSLSHPQEYYVEMEIHKASLYLIRFKDTPIGYFYLSAKDALLEYFLVPEWINQVDTIFGEIIQRFGVKTAWCKSFDHDLLACCYTYQKFSRVIGILFGDFLEKPLPPMPSDITIRLAEVADETRIQEVNEEVFDYPEEVIVYIKARKIFLFEKAGDLVGFGIFSRCIPGRPDFDIGMLVVEKYRRQGFASQILRYLVEHCRKNGWRPGAGCYVTNLPSRKSLEKVGFIARYRLLEFTF